MDHEQIKHLIAFTTPWHEACNIIANVCDLELLQA